MALVLVDPADRRLVRLVDDGRERECGVVFAGDLAGVADVLVPDGETAEPPDRLFVLTGEVPVPDAEFQELVERCRVDAAVATELDDLASTACWPA